MRFRYWSIPACLSPARIAHHDSGPLRGGAAATPMFFVVIKIDANLA